MAEVWLAEDDRLGRWVAIKALHESYQLGADEDAVAAFEREARVIARLQHPNIVAVHDAGTWEGRRYIVTEYVHGYSLRQILETQGRLTEAEVIRYGSQVASALQYAHEQGVIHCDVKPENILINETGVAKVADFGVAETVTRTLAPGQARDLLGTIAYLSPEVLQGSEPDARSDVYSLGLTLYELVAGRLPFAGGTPAALAGQRLTAPAPPLRTFARSATAELEGVLARAIATSPDDRYPTAGAFATALRRVTAPAPTQTAPVIAPPGRPPQLRSRQPTARVRRPAAPAPTGGGISGGTLLVVLGVILMGIAIGLIVALALSRGDDDPGGQPSPTPTEETATETPEPTEEPEATPTPTEEAEPSPSPTATTPPSPTATPTEEASPTPTEEPTEAPTEEAPTVTPEP